MFRSILACVLAVILGGGTAFAAARLELSLIAPKEEFALGEPLAIRAHLANVGDEPIQVMRHLRPEYTAVTYDIAGPVTRRYAPLSVKDAAEPFATLAPGATIEEEIDLFYGADSWVFTAPGRYQVTATYADSVRSPPLSLTVREPRDEAERTAAARLLASNEAGRFLMLGGGVHLQQGIAVLDGIAREQPQTPHAAYADLALGVSQLRPARDFASGTVRPADPQAAAQRLDRVRDEVLPLGRAVQARAGLATALRGLGQEARAREIEEALPNTIAQRFPNVSPESLRNAIIPEAQRQLRR